MLILSTYGICMTDTELVPLSCVLFKCSTGSVFVEQPIQNKYVPRRQRSSYTSWWRIAEVGVLHISECVQ
jgi:hypothetical protein